MNLIIVAWNVLGKFSLAQLIDRMIENGWNMLIVLEPQKLIGSLPACSGITIRQVNVGDQNIFVLHDETISSCTLNAQNIVNGARKSAVIAITSCFGRSYRILTAHSPYNKNDGSAALYQQNAIAWSSKNNIDLIMGDLNTYGSKVGSSSRSNFRNISEGLKTSRGGHPLDKALLRDQYYGLPNDVNADTMEQDEIELPDVSYVKSGSRSSTRTGVAQSRLGRHKESDHKPVLVSLPAEVYHSKPSSGAKFNFGSKEVSDIVGDGHCLYRCIAQIVWGDQERYQEVRRALANFILANWHAVPFLQHLQNIGQLDIYAQIIRSTSAWGGEFELATLADIYGLRITMYSPQGYANAVYGTGATAASIRHNGTHFEVG